jgi:hypothetical protein
MGLFNNYFVDQWVFPAFFIFLIVGSVFAFIIGLGLILRSAGLFRFFGVMNRWVPTRKAMRPVEIPRNVEEALHRRPLGAVFIVAAGLSLIVLIRGFDIGAIVSAFARGPSPMVIEIAARAVKWILLAGDVFAIIVGIALFATPQPLAALEARVNQWYSVRKYDRNIDRVHMGVDGWAQTYPRAIGWSFVILSVFVVMNLGAVILSRH